MFQILPSVSAVKQASAEYAALCEAEDVAAIDCALYDDEHAAFQRAYEARKRGKVRLHIARGSTRRFTDGIPQAWIDEEYQRYYVELCHTVGQAMLDDRCAQLGHGKAKFKIPGGDAEKFMRQHPLWFRFNGAHYVATTADERAAMMLHEQHAEEARRGRIRNRARIEQRRVQKLKRRRRHHTSPTKLLNGSLP